MMEITGDAGKKGKNTNKERKNDKVASGQDKYKSNIVAIYQPNPHCSFKL